MSASAKLFNAATSLILCVILTSSTCLGEGRPNVLLIISDDQRFDQVADYIMPQTQEQIFEQGISFTQAIITTPSCCPSRASILTGMYASTHGVKGNRYVLEKETLLEHFHESGYRTGLVGKYLNTSDGTPARGVDYWVGFKGGKADYENPRLSIQGVRQRIPGYLTDILIDYSVEFIKSAMIEDNPFLLVLTPNAPHWPAIPFELDKEAFSDLPRHRPKSHNERDRSDKPRWLRKRQRKLRNQSRAIDKFRLNQLRTLQALDRGVAKLLATLEEGDTLNKTVIVYLSDNGVMHLEHGLTDKDVAYEEAIRVPLAIRYPPLIASGLISSEVVANIDIAPTLYDLADIPIPADVDGLSLVPLFDGSGSLERAGVLIESWRNKGQERGKSLRVPFVGLRGHQKVCIKNRGDKSEYYDLATDPLQLENLISSQELPEDSQSCFGSLHSLLTEKRGAPLFGLPDNRPLPKGTLFDYSSIE